MNIQLEEIQVGSESSFHIMVNPNLSDFFFWHFHPEFELVYIEGANGNRHVGEHISQFVGSDLVFIGSNIPHLNFDYGIKTSYEKVVVHLPVDFLGNALLKTPELQKLNDLFENAKFGLAFSLETKILVAHRLKKLAELPYFEQFVEVLQILQILANAPEVEFLHTYKPENQHTKKDQERLKKLYALIDENFERKIDITEVAELSNLSDAAFCRYFKKMTRLTFTEFLNHYRINQAKKLLIQDQNISETCFSTGFESLSYFNRTFKKITKENPLAFKKRMKN
jgi:AraC-like DNA-binding protein